MTKNSSNPTPASSMADLLARHQSQMVVVKKGDIVEGTITRLTKHEVLVDINTKSEAVVLEKEKHYQNSISSLLKEGDKVKVQILSPESETGQPVVSLRRFVDSLLKNHVEALLKSQEKVRAVIEEVTKGGLVVSLSFGQSAFLPNSHLLPDRDDLTRGLSIDVYVSDINEKDNKVIVSQKKSVSDEEFETIKKSFKTGQKVYAKILNATSFGIFVAIPSPALPAQTIEGFIHVSEVAWQRPDNLPELFKKGQEIEAVVIGFDKDARRLELSIRKLTPDPFEEKTKSLTVDSRVKGTVFKIDDNGVHLKLDNELEGLIRQDKIPPGVVFETGKNTEAVVAEIDKRRRRILLVPLLKEKPIGYR